MKAPDKAAGRQAKCLKCGHPVQVPGEWVDRPENQWRKTAEEATNATSPKAPPQPTGEMYRRGVSGDQDFCLPAPGSPPSAADGPPAPANNPARPNERDDWGDKLYAWAKKNRMAVRIAEGASVTLLIFVLTAAFLVGDGGNLARAWAKYKVRLYQNPGARRNWRRTIYNDRSQL
jgi:hypothetical protein